MILFKTIMVLNINTHISSLLQIPSQIPNEFVHKNREKSPKYPIKSRKIYKVKRRLFVRYR